MPSLSAPQARRRLARGRNAVSGAIVTFAYNASLLQDGSNMTPQQLSVLRSAVMRDDNARARSRRRRSVRV